MDPIYSPKAWNYHEKNNQKKGKGIDEGRDALGDIATGELIVDYNIRDLVAVGGNLFYVRDNGAGPQTMKCNGFTNVLYARGAVDIEPVY